MKCKLCNGTGYVTDIWEGFVMKCECNKSYNWFEKLMVKCGILANEKDSKMYSRIDQELDEIEQTEKLIKQCNNKVEKARRMIR